MPSFGGDVQRVTLSDDQFNKLVELLSPGYELSSMMLAEYKATAEEAAKIAATALTGAQPAESPAPVVEPPANAGPAAVNELAAATSTEPDPPAQA